MERLPSKTILPSCSSQTPKQMFALELKNNWMRRSKKDDVHISDITLDCICHFWDKYFFLGHIIFSLRNKTMLFEYLVMSKQIHTNCNAHPDHPHRRCALLFSQQSWSVRSCRPENRGIGSRAEVTSDDHQHLFHYQDIIMVIVHMKCDERNDQLTSPIF